MIQYQEPGFLYLMEEGVCQGVMGWMSVVFLGPQMSNPGDNG